MQQKSLSWLAVHATAASARGKTKPKSKPASAPARGKSKLGALPEWNLADLYAGPDAPALKADLRTSERAADAMQEAYAGKLTALADGGKGGKALAKAVREYERLSDLMGRIVSYASLLYAADTSDPARQKFFGDIQEKITTISSKLLFFPLELNRLDDTLLEAAMADPELGHYRPWLEDLRKEKPYQLDDKLEQLFHEKAIIGTRRVEPAVQRDHDGAPLRRRGQEAQHRADPQSPARSGRDEAPAGSRSARARLQGQCAAVHADHQHARQGQGNLRPVARLCRCRR